MSSLHDVDPRFVLTLTDLASTRAEVLFERRGTGDSTYPFHGEVVAVNADSGTIRIRRTRTHAGEVHEMRLHTFLSVAVPSGERTVNRVAYERNEAYRAGQREREEAVAKAMASPAERPARKVLRSAYAGPGLGTLAGYPPDRHVFQDLVHSTRRASLIANSASAAEHFMAMQDIYMPLNDLLWHAIDGGVLWPAAIAFDRQTNPGAWASNWLTLYPALAGLPPNVLREYLDRVRSGERRFATLAPLSEEDVLLLLDRGLLSYEAQPSTAVDLLERVPVAGLRQLLCNAGSSFKARKREELAGELLAHITPMLEDAARLLMRGPLLELKAPGGLDVDEFGRAVTELRQSLFVMRQWLRADREIHREDALRQLVDAA
jgi:hypothetical protein